METPRRNPVLDFLGWAMRRAPPSVCLIDYQLGLFQSRLKISLRRFVNFCLVPLVSICPLTLLDFLKAFISNFYFIFLSSPAGPSLVVTQFNFPETLSLVMSESYIVTMKKKK